jgi:hypothetical protein
MCSRDAKKILDVESMPSFARNTAARNQPMRPVSRRVFCMIESFVDASAVARFLSITRRQVLELARAGQRTEIGTGLITAEWVVCWGGHSVSLLGMCTYRLTAYRVILLLLPRLLLHRNNQSCWQLDKQLDEDVLVILGILICLGNTLSKLCDRGLIRTGRGRNVCHQPLAGTGAR